MNEVSQANPIMNVAMESVLIDGDLSKLSSDQRVIYYKKTCDSLGLNYLTKPFSYLRLNGKLVLYATKDCSEQLRKRDGVSITKLETQMLDGVFVVTAYARTATGKEDVATGAVPTQNLKGEALANALMKAETKAKRRVTLSICGLGMTDEEEISSIPMAQKVNVDVLTGEIEEATVTVVKEAKVIIPREKLIDDIAKATTMAELKDKYCKAYEQYGGNLEAIKDITDLKDLRKKQLEDYQKAITEGTFDDPVPSFVESA